MNLTQWNLIAEWTALLNIVILIVYSGRAIEFNSIKERIFRVTIYSVFVTIVLNLLSTYIGCLLGSEYIWLQHFIMTLYYIALPLTPLMCFYYVICLIYCKRNARNLPIMSAFALIPYIAYTISLILNCVVDHVFTITQEHGYIQGDWYRLPYAIMGIYAMVLILIAFKNRKKFDKEIIVIVYIFPVVSVIIMIIQSYYYEIVLSGTSASATCLIIHFYLQSAQKTTDKLTGVLNRKIMLTNLKKRMQNEKTFSLVMFSIRNFKGINARMGLAYGDDVLIGIADYLKTIVSSKQIYRYSGDQFAVVFDDNEDENNVISDEMFTRLNESWTIMNNDCSINVIRAKIDYPKFGNNITDLLSALDYSIAKLKTQNGEATCLYDNSIYNEMCRKNEVITRLKEAIANDGIEAFYQPVYCAQAKGFTQAEALMRLKNNEINPIYPDEFIPLAEETGLIVSLTYIMIEKVCADLRRIIDEHGEKFGVETISVNVPYIQFLQPDIITYFVDILGKYNLTADRIRIEITERTLISDTETVRSIMGQMQEKGFIFEIDDFGVDYSNISLFMQLPIDVVKLDRSLILTAIENDKNRRFFECLTEGLNALDTLIIAEGVEDEETLKYVLDCGCGCVQGYVFSKPLPYDAFVSYILSYQKTHCDI